MGSFNGHAIPGTFFALMAVWWSAQLARRGHIQYRSEPWLVPRGPLYVDAFLVFVLTLTGIVGEASIGAIQQRPLADVERQHATMYSLFAIAAIVGMPRNTRCDLTNQKYFLFVVALLVELLLFHFHLHGRDSVDMLFHTLLEYSIMACLLSVLLEMYFRTWWCSLLRCLCLFVQGSWFWQAAFSLFGRPSFREPSVPPERPVHAVVTCTFALHIAAGTVIFGIIGLASQFVHEGRQREQYVTNKPEAQKLMSGSDEEL